MGGKSRPMRAQGVLGAGSLALLATSLPALPARAADPDKPAKRPISELLEDEFREDTESREQPSDDEFLTQRVEQVLNNFVDISGYFRSGYGRSGRGGPMVAFQAPG